ncbi:MAG: hypothetical protein IPH35_14480 [Rhodoferax sp.]|nr:hypothetical protein [Rhodoferax sp.]
MPLLVAFAVLYLFGMRSILDEAFIVRGLEPSIHEIYEPSVPDVLAAGLATTVWSVAE